MNRRVTFIVAASASLVLAVGVVSAAVPDGAGVIHGCFSANGAKTKGGTGLYVVDSASTTCSNGQAALNWNQTGPQGPQGIQGPQGTQGIQGPPGPSGITNAYATNLGLDPISLPAGNSPALIAQLDVPDGKFVMNATVEVYNSSFSDETYVNCQLRHGVVFGGTVLDVAETRLPVATVVGFGTAKLALTGTVDTTGDAADVVLDVVCSSLVGAGAQFGQLNATQVTTLTIQ